MIKKILSVLNRMKPYKDNFGWIMATGTFINAALKRNKAYEKQIMHYLDKNYNGLTVSIGKQFSEERKKHEKAERIIWSIWWQGEVDLPEVVVKSRESLQRNCGDYKVVLLSQYNIEDYITIPDYLMNHVKEKKVSFVHLADYIRVCILRKYGGIWLDATVFLLDRIPNEYIQHEFFSRHLSERNYATVAGGRWSGYFMATGEKDTLLYTFLEAFYNQYFQDHDIVVTYLLQDYLIDMAYRYFPSVKYIIDTMPVNNEGMKFIQEHMNDSYDQKKWSSIRKNTRLQKLSWKVKIDNNIDSYYRVVCCAPAFLKQ